MTNVYSQVGEYSAEEIGGFMAFEIENGVLKEYTEKPGVTDITII